MAQVRWPLQPMVAVERSDDLDHSSDRLEVALLESLVDEAQRLGQPGDLQRKTARRLFERARGDRLVDFRRMVETLTLRAVAISAWLKL